MPKFFSFALDHVEAKEVNNGDFLELKLYMISTGVNRNNSEFLEESFEPSIPSIYNKPILAYFNPVIGDTEEHNSKTKVDSYGETYYDYEYDGAEKPVGFIPESANITVEDIDGKKWIVVDKAYIWTEYNHELTKLIQSQITKKISVEIESIDSYDEDGIEKIKLWNFLGVTILGRTKFGHPIEEGIEGAHLAIKESIKKYQSKFNFALRTYNSTTLEKYGVVMDSYKEEFLSKTKFGTGKTIPVDKSKESVSYDAWGEISKPGLRNTVLMAKNYKTLVKSVYLLVEEGWEDSPSSKLKYPVMQHKDGKMVYNAGGLLSAQQYGAKYDKAIERKAKSIRKRLDLDRPEKEEHMKKFIEAAKDSGYTLVGMSGENLVFAMECDCDKEDMAANGVILYEISKETVDSFSENDEFAWDEITGKSIDLTTRDDGDNTEYADDEDEDEQDNESEEDSDDDEKKEMAARIECLEKEKAELAKRCESAECELKAIRMAQFKEDTDAILADEVVDMDDKTHEELCDMRDSGKFATVEDFAKEVAYRKYIANKAKKSEKRALSFALNSSNADKGEKKASLFDKLSKI